MKLNFAENLRKLRRDKNLTQEQLAEKLNVSFQSVSRWETAIKYPDIELLPVISDVFDVTVDELLGCSKAMRGVRFDNDMKQYYSMENNDEKLAFLRKMRKDYPNEWSVAQILCRLMFDLNSNLDELRALVTEILEGCTEQWIREDAIRIFCCMEDEALLPEFIKQYTTTDNMSLCALYEQRYLHREEWEKYEQQRQENLYYDLIMIFSERMRKAYHKSADDSAWAQKTSLEMIGVLTGTAGMNLVSGDGTPDLWIDTRLFLGMRLSSALASSGDADGAFEVLEDTVGLFLRNS